MKKGAWVFFVLIGLILFYVIQLQYISNISSQDGQRSLLQEKGDLCAGIAENAVANLQAIVEFQKLEILGRKVNVMRRCMADNGFEENPLWLAAAKPIAKKNATNLNLSEDEALENLKRESMYIFSVANKKPLYWQLKK